MKIAVGGWRLAFGSPLPPIYPIFMLCCDCETVMAVYMRIYFIKFDKVICCWLLAFGFQLLALLRK